MTKYPYNGTVGVDKEAGPNMQTYSGKPFFPLNPKQKDVCLEDIAHSLSLQCRFNGHSKFHYSVAQHSILVHDILKRNGESPHTCLLGLLHDAAEAYVGDMIRPLKMVMPEFEDLEEKVWCEIVDKFELWYTAPQWELIKWADQEALRIEMRDVVNVGTVDWGGLTAAPFSEQLTIYKQNPTVVEGNFLKIARILLSGFE